MTGLKSGIPLFSVLLLSACQNMPEPLWMHQALTPEPEVTEAPITSLPISNLYNSPALDAEIALAVNDFRILTFSDHIGLPPGIPERVKLANLTKHCGLRTLPFSSNLANASFSAKQHQLFFDYARQYNQFIFEACEKDFGRARR